MPLGEWVATVVTDLLFAGARQDYQQGIGICDYSTTRGPTGWDWPESGIGRWSILAGRLLTLSFSLRQLLEGGDELRTRVDQVWETAEVVSNLQPLPTIPDPSKILCVGANYSDHARESGMSVPTEPLIFNKLSTTLRASGQPIVLPTESDRVDFEAELVVVIGRRGHRIPVERAADFIAGYSCGHDVSARDWQKGKPGGQWLLGKSFDSFGPVGPYFVSADEIPDPHNLAISLRLNGQTMQSSSTANMVFTVYELIAYVSRVCTILPGDLLFTGTPAGVGGARQPPVFLKAGDQVEVELEGLGSTLSNPVIAAT